MKRGNPHTIKGKGFDAHPENINRKGQPKSFKKLFSELSDDDRKSLVDKLLKKGKAGDIRAIETIIDRIDGKIKQETEHSGNVTLKVNYGRKRTGN